MRKPAFCICENKDADQLRGNREADQRLCFRYIDSTIPLLPKSEISSLQLSCVAVQPGCVGPDRNPEDRFSHNLTRLILLTKAMLKFHERLIALTILIFLRVHVRSFEHTELPFVVRFMTWLYCLGTLTIFSS